MQSSSASCPAWPKGVWPRSCASAIASTRSSFEPQRARDRAAELRDLERMRQPRAEQVAFVVEEHLRLVDQAAERGGVHDAVAVALELGARGRRRLRVAAAARCARDRRRRARALIASARRVRRVQHCASTSRTSASGAPRTAALARAVDHDEADLAALRPSCRRASVRGSARRPGAGPTTGRPGARDQRGEPLRRRPRRPARAAATAAPPSPCRSRRPRRAATRRSPGRPRSHGRRCGRS